MLTEPTGEPDDMVSPHRTLLFEADPDLLSCVPEEDRVVAREVGVATLRLSPGPAPALDAGHGWWGLLLVEGVLAREVTVARSEAAELIGPGDVVMAASDVPEGLLETHATWTVLEPLIAMLLDERLAPWLSRWPDMAAGLMRRCERRTARLAVAQAISGATRIDTRVLGSMWELAGRWGRVGPEGVVLPLRLTHRTIARLVGARRPSVTTALRQLADAGRVSRREDGSWLLHGEPPPELGARSIDRIISRPAPRSAVAAH